MGGLHGSFQIMRTKAADFGLILGACIFQTSPAVQCLPNLSFYISL